MKEPRTRIKISKRQIGKIISLVLSLALIFSIFCVAPSAATAAESNKTSVAQSERQRGIPMPDGMIINQTPDSDPNRPEWNGLYKIYYFLAPDEWLDPAIAQYKEDGFEIGFYWFYGGSDDPNSVWPGDPAQNLAEYKINYFKYMNPSASEEDIAEFTANTEAVFGKVYYALCRSDANAIIWNNGINSGLPTDEDYDPAKAEAAQQTQDIKVQDRFMNLLGSPVEIPDDIYDSDEFFSTGEYEGNYVTGVTDLCGCITYVKGWELYENPLTCITSTQAVTNWKFYNPVSGEMTNKGFTDENGELILNDLGEAQSPYFDMDYTYMPPMPPTDAPTESPTDAPTEPPTGNLNPPHGNRPSFNGGTIYWECPWPTDGRIFKAYCHVWGSNGSSLYDWQDSKEEMTSAPEKGENVFKYDIPAGPYDEVIFSISTGVQTYDCVLTNDCIGKVAKTDKNNMLKNPMDSNKTAAATEFEGVASSGPHLGITSLGHVVGKVMCPTEDGANIVAKFIKYYLGSVDVEITADMLSNLVARFDTTAQDVYNVLASDSEFPSFTLDDGTKQLDKAAELLGLSGGSTDEPTSDATDPTGVTDPTGATDPTTETDPTGVTDPTTETDPTGATDPTGVTDPTGATNPTNPTNPTATAGGNNNASGNNGNNGNGGNSGSSNSGSSSTVTSSTSSNSSATGKVATGDSTSVVMLVLLLMLSASATAACVYKRRNRG